MTELQWFMQLLGAHPGSVTVLVGGTIMTIFYSLQVGDRISNMERKLGLKPSVNGGNLAVVVTRGDLVAFEKSLIETLRREFRDKEMCDLQHLESNRRIAALEEYRSDHP